MAAEELPSEPSQGLVAALLKKKKKEAPKHTDFTKRGSMNQRMFYKLGVGMEWEGFSVVLGCTSQAYTLNVPSVKTKQKSPECRRRLPSILHIECILHIAGDIMV